MKSAKASTNPVMIATGFVNSDTPTGSAPTAGPS